jgi:hypothetical protein
MSNPTKPQPPATWTDGDEQLAMGQDPNEPAQDPRDVYGPDDE